VSNNENYNNEIIKLLQKDIYFYIMELQRRTYRKLMKHTLH